MDIQTFQMLVLLAGTLASVGTMFWKIRKEIQRSQKESLEQKVAEERRAMALENRINLLEQKTTQYGEILSTKLSDLTQRLDLLYSLFYEQISSKQI
jgi:predicted  nucleic acid-binding Zn-ribbon protein